LTRDPDEKERIRHCIGEGQPEPTFLSVEVPRCNCGWGSEKSGFFSCNQCGLQLPNPNELKANGEGVPLSTAATNFLRACLCRDVAGRVTAEEALNMEFISGTSFDSGEGQERRCLKGSLESAAKSGAFSKGFPREVESQKQPP
jgi:hypothetical protein